MEEQITYKLTINPRKSIDHKRNYPFKKEYGG